MNVLVACEESQRVCIEFRKRGHEAFSCDIQDESGGHPEWHIKGDVIPLLNGNCEFQTCDGIMHKRGGRWDMIIAFPPCTYLCVSGNGWFNVERYGEKAVKRLEDRNKAIQFFMAFVNANCDRIAIENPIGVMSTVYQKPDCIINPFEFGHPEQKKTCLWLKGLPPLIETNNVYQHMMKLPKNQRERIYWLGSGHSKERSKTFPGIARAMAEQWGSGIIKTKEPYQLYFDGYV